MTARRLRHINKDKGVVASGHLNAIGVLAVYSASNKTAKTLRVSARRMT